MRKRIWIDDLHFAELPDDYTGEFEYSLTAFDGTRIRHSLRFRDGELTHDDKAVESLPSSTR